MISPKLLSFPIFQGISSSDLKEIMGYTRFDFKKVASGKTIVKCGDRCRGLIFLLDGRMEAVTANSDRSFLVREFIDAPVLLQLERVFGLTQYYSSTFVAHTLCHTMSISKEEVSKLYNSYDVVRINIINLLATRLQRFDENRWRTAKGDLRQRLVRFFVEHCLHPAGDKTIHTKMTTLAAELNDSRLNVSIELNRLQDEQLISISRSRIHIPALERLLV